MTAAILAIMQLEAVPGQPKLSYTHVYTHMYIDNNSSTLVLATSAELNMYYNLQSNTTYTVTLPTQ